MTNMTMSEVRALREDGRKQARRWLWDAAKGRGAAPTTEEASNRDAAVYILRNYSQLLRNLNDAIDEKRSEVGNKGTEEYIQRLIGMKSAVQQAAEWAEYTLGVRA